MVGLSRLREARTYASHACAQHSQVRIRPCVRTGGCCPRAVAGDPSAPLIAPRALARVGPARGL
eukprot:4521828-Prymnesium_polylepis.1